MISKESVGVEISSNKLTIAYVKATPFNTKICAHAAYDLDANSRFGEKMETISSIYTTTTPCAIEANVPRGGR